MQEVIGTCPFCSAVLVMVNECGIVDYDGRWEAQTTRYVCEVGHMIFATLAEPIEQAEEQSALATYE